jgi:hypothetical protein
VGGAVTLQPPAVPDFRPGVAAGTVPALFNNLIRDPLTFLESKVVFRARRTSAWNVNSAAADRFVPWDTADEDPYSGWTSPVDVGGGGSTTLNGATAVGAANFVVASATNLAIGDYVRIGPSGANREHRQIAGLAGTTVTPDQPLALAHASGDAVVEVTSDPSVYVCQAPGWYLAEGAISISSSQVTTAAQVLIPKIAVDEASPLGPGTLGWEGGEIFQAAAAVQHYASGVWQFYAAAGQRIRLDYFMSSETAGAIAVSTTAVCRLSLTWAGV